jgi:hypothetical protein
LETFPEGSPYRHATAQKAELLKTALRLTKLCRGTIAKRFVKVATLLFRNAIFSETKSATPQFMKLKLETLN